MAAPYDWHLPVGVVPPVPSDNPMSAAKVALGADCHSGPNFTDGKFHVFGHREGNDAARDHGLAEITGAAKDEGAFRTPSLRNVALTAPYLHDGSAPDLASALRAHAGVTADEHDVPEMLAFLESLSDTGFVTNPDFTLPRTACGKPLYPLATARAISSDARCVGCGLTAAS